ncbi:MAG TPA: DUF1572 family protein, partial [Pyrinomonadaceae bacterium]|nr:DUF1572 family protein [Pyrinomonadaceae bacterium]
MTTPEKSKSLEASLSTAFINEAVDFLTGEYLPKIERCLEQLTEEQIWWRSNEQCNSIGNLILHLCGNVTQWIAGGVGRRPYERLRQQEFEERRALPKTELLQRLGAVVATADEVL